MFEAFLSTILTFFLITEVELKGNLSGSLDYSGEVVVVREGDSVRVVPYGTNGDYGSTGWLIVKAKSIYIEGVIDGMGRGYGGGGGGGGAVYNDYGDAHSGIGGGDNARFEGDPGGDAYYEEIVPGQQWAVYGGDGGSGGGIGGDGGMDGDIGTGGTGGRGAGPYGGAGGAGTDDGGPGGYMGTEINGDATIDFNVVMGSGGGGGGGGDATDDNGYPGGSGGVGGGAGCHNAYRPKLSGGGGGGGGGAGGAAITLDATDTLSISGAVIADGAGSAELGGGYGAGGGIALRGGIVDVNDGLIRTLGGFSDGKGTRINGGTIKIFYKNLEGDVAEENAGRVYKKETGVGIEEEKRSLPLIIVSPNPSKAGISVKCQVSGGKDINLKVYDVSGKLIKTLTKTQSLKPKVSTIVWDGRNEDGNSVPGGVYFLKLEGKGYAFIRKLTLMR